MKTETKIKLFRPLLRWLYQLLCEHKKTMKDGRRWSCGKKDKGLKENGLEVRKA